MMMQMTVGMTFAILWQSFRKKLSETNCFTISFTVGQHEKKKKKETIQQGQEVQSLDISGTCFHPHSLNLPFTSSSKNEAVRREMDGLSVARFPKANRV